MKRLHYIIIIMLTAAIAVSCSKDSEHAPLADGSITFAQLGESDTIEMPLSILKDSAITLHIQAMLAGDAALRNHQVSFAVDTSKMLEYRNRYGAALLMPHTSYLLYKKDVSIAAGSTLSDNAEINIGQQRKLVELSTYVLPIVISAVDGLVEGPASERVMYLVFKTGEPFAINRVGWTIQEYSSFFSPFRPPLAIDNDDENTYWTSNIVEQMPQWLTINFNEEIEITGVNYFVPKILYYPTQGGYPATIRIETSMDGSTWNDHGIFEGNIVNNTQTLQLGLTTARYLRFTVLSAVKYAATYDAIFISGISLQP